MTSKREEGLEKIGFEGIKEWTDTKRVGDRARMGSAEHWKQNIMRFIWTCCRFSFMEKEEKGNLDGTDLFFYKKTELERITYGSRPLNPLI